MRTQLLCVVVKKEGRKEMKTSPTVFKSDAICTHLCNICLIDRRRRGRRGRVSVSVNVDGTFNLSENHISLMSTNFKWSCHAVGL